MQRRRRRIMVADLVANVFGDRASRALLPADVAPAAALGLTSTAAANATAPAAVDAATHAPTSPPNGNKKPSLASQPETLLAALPSLIDPPPELKPSIAEAVSFLSPKCSATKGEGKSKKACDAMLNTSQKSLRVIRNHNIKALHVRQNLYTIGFGFYCAGCGLLGITFFILITDICRC
ncbi:hypothetical protein MRB53_030230 [Persea americana]|uniref:Uncharacterized protein n=1 Tax=Persea americana TaxID=3435 RepID=A0ACC2KKQ2_PERAE|nr:hypothetical protein MRB53_030230 [Persea americana]